MSNGDEDAASATFLVCRQMSGLLTAATAAVITTAATAATATCAATSTAAAIVAPTSSATMASGSGYSPSLGRNNHGDSRESLCVHDFASFLYTLLV